MITAWKRIRGSAAIIVGGVLISSIVSAQAPMVQPEVPAFGLLGIAPASQFVRLNVTNMRVTGMAFLAPPGTLTVGPCRVSLILGDGQGGTLKRSDAHLAPGQSTSLDLTVLGSPASSVPGRVEILPAVQRSDGCILVPSVEVIASATSQTDAYILRKSANGNGFIPAYGMVGMAPASQFIRFNLSNQPIAGVASFGDCSVVLAFLDGRGGPVKQGDQTILRLETSTHLDLTAADLNGDLARASRVEVLPSLTHSGTCALNSSVEVISTVTGQTNAYAADAVLSTNH